jgi:hypothetical protein
VGRRPSVSTVNDIAAGIPAFCAARDANRFLHIVHGDGADYIRGGSREGIYLLLVIGLCVLFGHGMRGYVAIAAGTHASTNDNRPAVRHVVANLFQQTNRGTAGIRQRFA